MIRNEEKESESEREREELKGGVEGKSEGREWWVMVMGKLIPSGLTHTRLFLRKYGQEVFI